MIMRKRIISMGIRAILSITAFFAVAAMTGKNAFAQNYNIYIGSQQVSDEVLSGNCDGGGTWSFSKNNSKYYLYLDNANITDCNNVVPANIYANLDKPLEIRFTGNNTLSGQEYAIVSRTSLNLLGYNTDDSVEATSTTGPAVKINVGSLYVNVTKATFKSTNAANSGAIDVQSDITLQNGVFNVINESDDIHAKGLSSSGGNITFDNCTVSAKGKEDAVYASGEIKFQDNRLKVIEPANGGISDGKHSIVDKDNGNRRATSVIIGIPRTVSVSAAPADGGTVEGGKTYARGLKATVKATPNSGYSFENWTKNGNIMSGNAEYEFTVGNDDYDLVANFSSNAYTITYKANNGSDDTDTQTVTKGNTVNLKQNGFTYAGHTFKEWTEGADGSGRSYKDKESVRVNGNMTLYAQWQENEAGTYSVTVTSTEGGSSEADKNSGKTDDEVKLSATADKGYGFKEWTVEAGGWIFRTRTIPMPPLRSRTPM
jgi:uncharacterized repeat protein (TIGR02543 family)